MVATDPPDHTRLRRLVSGTFTTATIDNLRPRIQQLTDDLLDAVATARGADLIESLAVPLPVTVISELGVRRRRTSVPGPPRPPAGTGGYPHARPFVPCPFLERKAPWRLERKERARPASARP